ncbi:Hypothetical_protein [Hexamita inflata]|uniref:Hypothetical_protein n=1 Tax=Hexamita inflata TaxID=28002 RepID=A0AA86U877_9EUKA|nr:Hypothetical protein HINF_LOCUS5722 [Hexamita inflata]CAI9946900.1 Hypothetical protein HINF_LOCUS34545 [Hexamita inflata]
MELTPGALPTPGTFTIRKKPQSMYQKTLSSHLIDVKTTKDVLSALLKEFKTSEEFSEEFIRNFSELLSSYAYELHYEYASKKNIGEAIETIRQRYPELDQKPNE